VKRTWVAPKEGRKYTGRRLFKTGGAHLQVLQNLPVGGDIGDVRFGKCRLTQKKHISFEASETLAKKKTVGNRSRKPVGWGGGIVKRDWGIAS